MSAFPKGGRPSRIAWILSLFSLLVFVTVIAAAGLALLATYRSTAYTALTEDLGAQRFAGARPHVREAHAGDAVLDVLFATPTYAPSRRGELAAETIEVLDLLGRSRPLEARDRIEQITGALPASGADGSEGDPAVTRTVTTLRDAAVRLEECRHHLDELARSRDESTALSERSRRYLQQYELLRGELADLLQVPDTGEGALSFYRGGVLAPLPVIAGIPDELPDSAALMEELRKRGGRVELKGEGAYENFITRLETLKSQSSALAADITAQETLEKEVRARRDETRARLRECSARDVPSLVDTVRDLSAPPPIFSLALLKKIPARLRSMGDGILTSVTSRHSG